MGVRLGRWQCHFSQFYRFVLGLLRFRDMVTCHAVVSGSARLSSTRHWSSIPSIFFQTFLLNCWIPRKIQQWPVPGCKCARPQASMVASRPKIIELSVPHSNTCKPKPETLHLDSLEPGVPPSFQLSKVCQALGSLSAYPKLKF